MPQQYAEQEPAHPIILEIVAEDERDCGPCGDRRGWTRHS